MKKIFLILIICISAVCNIFAATIHTVYLNPNGGNISTKAHGIVDEIGYTFLIDPPTREGYVLQGWLGTGTPYLCQGMEEMAFSGSNHVDLGSERMFSDNITVNIWANMSDWTNFSGMTLIDAGGWKIAENEGKITFSCSDVNGNRQSVSAVACASLSSGWHMFTLVVNGRNLWGFIDRKIYGPAAISPFDYGTAQTIVVGANSNLQSGFFSGKMNGIAIANTSIDIEGLRLLYSETSASHGDLVGQTRYFVPSGVDSAMIVAQWSPPHITIDPNGGEYAGTSSPTIYTDLTTSIFQLADATRNGYTFGGWLETKTLADNSTWVNVFYHNIASGEWFTTNKSAYNAGAGGADIREPLATKSINDRNRFALFNQLDFLKTGEKYEFLLEFGTKPAEFNRWKQTVNPAKTTDENSSAAAMRTKIGYEATSSNIKWNHANWCGLAQSDFPNNTFLDGYCPSGWGFAVGAYRAYEGGVPAGYYASANPFIETKNCRLWVRADADLANIATLLKESNGGQKLANDARNSAGEIVLRNGTTYKAVWIPKDHFTDLKQNSETGNWFLYNKSNLLYIKGIEAKEIVIFSLTGQKLRSVENCNSLSLSGLKGVYLVQILAKSGEIRTEKIVIN